MRDGYGRNLRLTSTRAIEVERPQRQHSSGRCRNRCDNVLAIAGIEKNLAQCVFRVESPDDAAFDNRFVEQPGLTSDANERDQRSRAIRQSKTEESRRCRVQEL